MIFEDLSVEILQKMQKLSICRACMVVVFAFQCVVGVLCLFWKAVIKLLMSYFYSAGSDVLGDCSNELFLSGRHEYFSIL